MAFNKKKILITGARGFIGKELIKKLKKNYIIYAISGKDIKNTKNIVYYNYNKSKKLAFLNNLNVDYLSTAMEKFQTTIIKIYTMIISYFEIT